MSTLSHTQAYSDYFGGAPVIQVPGRLYPIQMEYVAPELEKEGGRGRGRRKEGEAEGGEEEEGEGGGSWGGERRGGRDGGGRPGGRGSAGSVPQQYGRGGGRAARGGGGGGKQQQLLAGSKDRSQEQIDPKPYLKLLQRLDTEIPASQRGDMLVFVAGMADIVALSDALRPYAMQGRRWLILPLHRCV